MTSKSLDANAWRIEMSRELAQIYSKHKAVKMIVLGGSPTHGLADQYSDLDIIVYWDKMDDDWLKAAPLRNTAGTRVSEIVMAEGAVYLESYKYGNLKADFGHLTLGSWDEWVGSFVNDLNIDGGLQKMISGFLTSIPLYGDELVTEHKQRIPVYPDGMAEMVVSRNLALLVEGCLLHQGWDRKDLLFYYDGLCLMFKRVIGMLAGLNRVYCSLDEPRWIEHELNRMAIKPSQTWGRILTALQSPGPEAVVILEELLAETIELVRENMPEVDLSRLEQRKSLGVLPCPEKPRI